LFSIGNPGPLGTIWQATSPRVATAGSGTAVARLSPVSMYQSVANTRSIDLTTGPSTRHISSCHFRPRFRFFFLL
jgi:hypothetical protein